MDAAGVSLALTFPDQTQIPAFETLRGLCEKSDFHIT